ncbi:MAG: DUF4252 domain-containing protein [Bacteroides sp.]|nr:DUF4252 domain-containing protein [Bacteroides sp.]
MKAIKLTLTCIGCLFITMGMKGQSSIFDKYNDMQNVSSVFISKAMIEMQPKLYTNDVYIGKVAGKLEGVYVISTLDNKVKQNLRKDIDDLIRKGKYELLMKQKGLTSSSAFYIKKKGDRIQELVMISDGAAKLNFTQLVGDLTLEDIQNITKRQMAHINLPQCWETYQDIALTGLEKGWKSLEGLKDMKIDCGFDFESLKGLGDLTELESLKDLHIYVDIERIKKEIDQAISSVKKEKKTISPSVIGLFETKAGPTSGFCLHMMIK